MILAQLEPMPTGSDGLLEQMGTQRMRAQRLRKGAAHHHVARLVEFAKQAGVALDGAVSIDRGARRKYGRRV
jgi:hypothetical protein